MAYSLQLALATIIGFFFRKTQAQCHHIPASFYGNYDVGFVKQKIQKAIDCQRLIGLDLTAEGLERYMMPPEPFGNINPVWEPDPINFQDVGPIKDALCGITRQRVIDGVTKRLKSHSSENFVTDLELEFDHNIHLSSLEAQVTEVWGPNSIIYTGKTTLAAEVGINFGIDLVEHPDLIFAFNEFSLMSHIAVTSELTKLDGKWGFDIVIDEWETEMFDRYDWDLTKFALVLNYLEYIIIYEGTNGICTLPTLHELVWLESVCEAARYPVRSKRWPVTYAECLEEFRVESELPVTDIGVVTQSSNSGFLVELADVATGKIIETLPNTPEDPNVIFYDVLNKRTYIVQWNDENRLFNGRTAAHFVDDGGNGFYWYEVQLTSLDDCLRSQVLKVCPSVTNCCLIDDVCGLIETSELSPKPDRCCSPPITQPCPDGWCCEPGQKCCRPGCCGESEICCGELCCVEGGTCCADYCCDKDLECCGDQLCCTKTHPNVCEGDRFSCSTAHPICCPEGNSDCCTKDFNVCCGGSCCHGLRAPTCCVGPQIGHFCCAKNDVCCGDICCDFFIGCVDSVCDIGNILDVLIDFILPPDFLDTIEKSESDFLDEIVELMSLSSERFEIAGSVLGSDKTVIGLYILEDLHDALALSLPQVLSVLTDILNSYQRDLSMFDMLSGLEDWYCSVNCEMERPPMNEITELPTDVTEFPTDITDFPSENTEFPTATTEFPTHEITEPPIESPTSALTEPPTNAVPESPTNTITESPTGTITESPTNSATEPSTNTATEFPTSRISEFPTSSVTEPPTDLTQLPTESPELPTEQPPSFRVCGEQFMEFGAFTINTPPVKVLKNTDVTSCCERCLKNRNCANWWFSNRLTTCLLLPSDAIRIPSEHSTRNTFSFAHRRGGESLDSRGSGSASSILTGNIFQPTDSDVMQSQDIKSDVISGLSSSGSQANVFPGDISGDVSGTHSVSGDTSGTNSISGDVSSIIHGGVFEDAQGGVVGDASENAFEHLTGDISGVGEQPSGSSAELHSTGNLVDDN